MTLKSNIQNIFFFVIHRKKQIEMIEVNWQISRRRKIIKRKPKYISIKHSNLSLSKPKYHSICISAQGLNITTTKIANWRFYFTLKQFQVFSSLESFYTFSVIVVNIRFVIPSYTCVYFYTYSQNHVNDI